MSLYTKAGKATETCSQFLKLVSWVADAYSAFVKSRQIEFRLLNISYLERLAWLALHNNGNFSLA